MTQFQADALERWMYRKDGMDYGPFTGREIEHMLEARELLPEAEVYQRRTKQWVRIQDVPHFRDFLTAMTRREAEQARQREIQRDHAQIERQTRRGHTGPLVLGGLAAVAIGVTAFFLLRPPPPVLAGYPATFFRDLSFERLSPVAAVVASPVRTTAVSPDAMPRRARNGAAHRAAVPGKGDYLNAPQVDLSFDAEDVSGGRALAPADLDALQQRVTPALIRCFRGEVERFDAFEGGSVSLYVMNKGSVAVSRLSTTPGPSSDLVACVRSAAAAQHVPPFAGAAQVMEIPLRVAGVR